MHLSILFLASVVHEINGKSHHRRRANGIFDSWKIYKGTKWCGAGHIAKNYDDLGEYPDVDRCCREHDHCPYNIAGDAVKDQFKNPKSFTVSECGCDEKFFDCLKAAKEHPDKATNVGNLYFNLLKPPCVKKEDGKYCKEWDTKKFLGFFNYGSPYCKNVAEGKGVAVGYSYLQDQFESGKSAEDLSVGATPEPLNTNSEAKRERETS